MSLAAFRTDLQFSRVKAFIFCLHLEKKSIQYMFHHIVPNEGPNGSYNGFCINLVVNSVKDGNEKSVGLDVDLLMSLAAFRTDLQFSRVKAFMCLSIEKKRSYV